MKVPGNDEGWVRNAAPEPLRDGQVALWRVWTDDLPAGRLEELAALLNGEERSRAERFRFDRDRNRYIVSRASLRLLLGEYTQTRATDLEFVYGDQGKPALATPIDEVEFNLSHSADLCLFAFANFRRVGIDIESKERDVSFVELAMRFFSKSEYEAIRQLSPSNRREAFYAVWTRKEAYIKALGEGVTHGLDNFSVTVDPESETVLVNSKRDPEASSLWQLRSFQPAEDFAGAVAAEGDDVVIRRFEFRP